MDVESEADADDAGPIASVLLSKLLFDIHSHIILNVIFLQSLFRDTDRILLHLCGIVNISVDNCLAWKCL